MRIRIIQGFESAVAVTVALMDLFLCTKVADGSCSLFQGGLHLLDLSAGSASTERLYVRVVNQRVVSWRDAVMLAGTGLQHLARLSLTHVEIQVVLLMPLLV